MSLQLLSPKIDIQTPVVMFDFLFKYGVYFLFKYEASVTSFLAKDQSKIFCL